MVPSNSPVASSSVNPRPSVFRRIVSGARALVPSPSTSSPIHKKSPTSHLSSQLTPHIVVPRQGSSFVARKQPSPRLVEQKRPEWSVTYNPDIKQTFRMDLANTFDVMSNVYCAKFSPDGKYLALGLWAKGSKTYIYDVEKGCIDRFLMDLYLDDETIVWSVEFSPDGKHIATGSSDSRIRLWDVSQKRIRAMFDGRSTSATALSFSPNGRFLVSGCGGGAARVWSLRDGSSKTLINGFFLKIFSITFSPDGRHIACLDVVGELRIWGARTGHLLDQWRAHVKEAFCLRFSPDGKGLVSGGDKELKYWDVSSLAVMGRGRGQIIDGDPGQRFPLMRSFQGHTGIVRSVSFSPDNRWVATGSKDTTVRIWDPWTAEWRCTLHGHSKYARTVDFSPTGKYLATGAEDGLVRIWRLNPILAS